MSARHKTSSWYQTHRLRSFEKKQTTFRRRFKFNRVILLGFGLTAVSLWSVIAVFGPVLIAEAGYQVKTMQARLMGNYGDWTAFMMPGPILPGFGQTLSDNEIGLVIPKIFVKEKVIIGVDPSSKPDYLKALQIGVAQAQGTALPGEPGLGYYFAHSSGMNILAPQKKAAFYLLGKLSSGDRIYLYSGDQVFSYQLTEMKVTEADDLSFLGERGGEERIVLQTCWPIGTSLRRLLVFGERV